MYNIYSPEKDFNGNYAGYEFKNGVATAELDENLKLWFKMLGFKTEKAKEPIKKTTIKVDKIVKEPIIEEEKAKEENKEK